MNQSTDRKSLQMEQFESWGWIDGWCFFEKHAGRVGFVADSL